MTTQTDPKPYDEMTVNELQIELDNLKDELMENDAELGRRRFRPDSGSRVAPLPNYNTWRAEKVARQSEIRRDIQLVKSLMYEQRLTNSQEQREQRNVGHRRRTHLLQCALDEIVQDPTASESVLLTARRALTAVAADRLSSE